MMNFITYDSEDYANEYYFNLKIMYPNLQNSEVAGLALETIQRIRWPQQQKFT